MPSLRGSKIALGRTLDVRLDGKRSLNPDWKPQYTVEYAKQ